MGKPESVKISSGEDLISVRGGLERDLYSFAEDVNLNLGTDFTNLFAEVEADEICLGSDNCRTLFNANAGLVLDGGHLEPYAGVEVSHDLSQRLGLESGLHSDVDITAGFSTDDPSYILSSVGYGYDRLWGNTDPLRSAEVRLVGGMHDENAVVGIQGNMSYDIFDITPNNTCYLFNGVAFSNINAHLESGVGCDFTIPKTFEHISVELGGQYNSDDNQLPTDGYGGAGPEDASAFLRLSTPLSM